MNTPTRTINTDFWSTLIEISKDKKTQKRFEELNFNIYKNILSNRDIKIYKKYTLLKNIGQSFSYMKSENVILDLERYNSKECIDFLELISEKDNIFVITAPVFSYENKNISVSEQKITIENFIGVLNNTNISFFIYTFRLTEDDHIMVRYATYEKNPPPTKELKEITETEQLKLEIKELTNRVEKLESKPTQTDNITGHYMFNPTIKQENGVFKYDFNGTNFDPNRFQPTSISKEDRGPF